MLFLYLFKNKIKKIKKIMISRFFKTLRRIYHLMRVFAQLVYGIIRISPATTPMITIFGGAHAQKSTYYFQQASKLGALLVERNISVLTGGGPGIMEAASCGGFSTKKRTAKIIGIGVTNLDQKRNKCVDHFFSLDYFFARKLLLTNYSRAFVFFPGGFGTLDELFEVITLLQTKQMSKIPIVLFGIEYWMPFINWIKQEALAQGLIEIQDLNFLTLTDDLEEALCIIADFCNIR